MATIDELIVRLDADLKPLETKLKRAERLMTNFSATAERALGKPSAQMAALIRPRSSRLPSNKTSREELHVNMGESGAATTQAAVLPAIGKILLDITVSVGTGLASNFILDTFLSDEFKPQKELFREGFDPNRIQQAFFEFQARSEDLARAAEEAALAEDRIIKELGSIESTKIADEIKVKLQEQLNKAGTDIAKDLNELFTATGNTERLREAFTKAQEAREAQGLEGDLTGAETARTTLQTALDLNLITKDAAEALSKRFNDIEQALETIEAGIPDAETQARIDRAREAANPVQQLEIEIPERVGNVCDCIRDLFDRLPGGRETEPLGELQTVSASSTFGPAANAFAPSFNDLEKTSATMRGLVGDTQKLAPIIADTRRETAELDRVARDLGLTFSSALEDAIVDGESLSEILQGLERDILRILVRTLVTEPIAAGIRGGIRGEDTKAGGLEGLFNAAVGGGASLFADEAEQPSIARVDSEIAEATSMSLLALTDAGDATGAVLRGALSDGALKAGAESLSQATAANLASRQLRSQLREPLPLAA